jgi:hypothetical protein
MRALIALRRSQNPAPPKPAKMRVIDGVSI